MFNNEGQKTISVTPISLLEGLWYEELNTVDVGNYKTETDNRYYPIVAMMFSELSNGKQEVNYMFQQYNGLAQVDLAHGNIVLIDRETQKVTNLSMGLTFNEVIQK